MPSLGGQIIFLKVRRIVELVTIILLIVIIYALYSGEKPQKLNNETESAGDVLDHSNLRQKRFGGSNGRPDLAKYIHLDLKGAPPKADKFYESFFDFLEKIQMGIKGVLIEYEDTLPLEGNLANVSLEKNLNS